MTESPTRARVLLSGYYGFDNFGDEAILRIFVEQWRSRRPHDVIDVLSARPTQTAAEYSVESTARADIRAVDSAIRRADLVISGGGGLLQSSTSIRSLLYYAGIIREAKRAGKPAAIFAQGIGPLDFFGKQIVKRFCHDVDFAGVRDEESAQLLRSLLPGKDVSVAADPVFLADAADGRAGESALAAEGLGSLQGDVVAVVVRNTPLLARVAGDLAAGIDRLSEAFGAHVVFIPLQRPADAEAAIEIIRRCRSAPTLLGGGYDLPAMAALLGRCTAVVSMRLHALVLAAALGTPFMAIPYDPKVDALVHALRYPLPPLSARTPGLPLFDRLMGERAALRAHLAESAPRMAASASSGFDRLAAFAEGATGRALKTSV